MPSARRRIAIIITTLVIAALPAMVPALIIFADTNRVAGAGAGIVALGSWIMVEAAALLLITPIFTDMRLPFIRALRVSAVGIGIGVLVTAPLAWVLGLSLGAPLGLIAGIWAGQREIGRALGALSASLRADITHVGATIAHLPGALRRLVGMLSGRHPITVRPPAPAPEAPPRIADLPVPAEGYRAVPPPERAAEVENIEAPPELPAPDAEPGRRRGDGI